MNIFFSLNIYCQNINACYIPRNTVYSIKLIHISIYTHLPCLIIYLSLHQLDNQQSFCHVSLLTCTCVKTLFLNLSKCLYNAHSFFFFFFCFTIIWQSQARFCFYSPCPPTFCPSRFKNKETWWLICYPQLMMKQPPVYKSKPTNTSISQSVGQHWPEPLHLPLQLHCQ